jgi:hypothetical protein
MIFSEFSHIPPLRRLGHNDYKVTFTTGLDTMTSRMDQNHKNPWY